MRIIGITGQEDGVQAGVGKDEVARVLAEALACAVVALADPMKRFARAVFAFSHEQLWGPSAARNATDERYTTAHSLPDRAITPPVSAWLSAWDRLEFVGPQWLESLGLDAAVHMPGLRRWFAALAMEAAGLDRRLAPLGERKPTSARRVLQTMGTDWGRTVNENIWVDYMVRVAEKLTSEPGFGYDRAQGIVRNPRVQLLGVIVPDVRFGNESLAIRARSGEVVRVIRPGAGLDGEAAKHASERGISNDLVDAVIVNDGTLEQLHERVREYAALKGAA